MRALVVRFYLYKAHPSVANLTQIEPHDTHGFHSMRALMVRFSSYEVHPSVANLIQIEPHDTHGFYSMRALVVRFTFINSTHRWPILPRLNRTTPMASIPCGLSWSGFSLIKSTHRWPILPRLNILEFIFYIYTLFHT